jgi:hypothetical protein
VIVHGLDLSENKHEMTPPVSQAAWDSLGLTETAYMAIFHETELRFAAMNQIIQ